MAVGVVVMSLSLHWKELTLCQKILPADHVLKGEHVRLVMHERMQRVLLDKFFLCPLSQGCTSDSVWLERDQEILPAGSSAFCEQVGCVIRQRGLLANLTLKENLLLPFLYADDAAGLQRAEKDLQQVASFLELDKKLNEKAGERSIYMHGLMSLGHCLLKQPNIIISQELHLGMQAEFAAKFRRKVLRAMEIFNPGVLYLTDSKSENSGLLFHRSYRVQCDMDTNMEKL